MYEISKQNRDSLCQYLDNSLLPHADVKELLKMLMLLKEIKTEEPKA